MSYARIFRAAVFAAHKHKGQIRKNTGGSPYINHPLRVAEVLSAEGGVEEEPVLVAALLHDTVEDTSATLAEIEAEFGADIAGFVDEVTDDKGLPDHERKELQVVHAPHLSRQAKLIKIADKICNVRDIAADPPAGWKRQRRAEYVDWAERVIAGCRGINATLERLFDEAAADARAALEDVAD